MISRVDFIGIPTRDLDRAIEFYGTTLELERSVYIPERHYAEFENGTVTFSVIVAEKMGLTFAPTPNPVALHVDDVESARATLRSRGVEFAGDIFDTGVCHMAFFSDPDGNALMLHHRYAPRG
jgi:predicted enzyme related to lactoylglutathione lyase